MSHIVVVANGEFRHRERLLSCLRSADLVIAADGGANWLHAQSMSPHVLVGDLDSVEPALLRALEDAHCDILRFPPAKDETDTELALHYAARQRPARITLIGALGGRLDHELANVMLLALPALQGISVAIYDGISSTILVTSGRTTLTGSRGDLVSLLAWGGDCLGVTTCGLEYPLRDEPLPFGPARGVSNVMVAASATVSLREGRLLVVHTPQDTADEASP